MQDYVHPCPLKPIRTAQLWVQNPQTGNRIRENPCFSCWETHMKTMLLMCYMSNPCMFLVSGAVSGSHQGSRLLGTVELPVESLFPLASSLLLLTLTLDFSSSI